MREREEVPVPRAPAPEPAQAHARSPAADALSLQRAVGNRAAARMLSRWAAHPDKDKKGVFVPDEVAQGYVHFNPPTNS